MVIGLVACCSKKLNIESLAKDLYISPLFIYSMKYLDKRCDKIFILSAKYGLLDLNKRINPYNETLNKMDKKKRINWNNKVLSKLKSITDLHNDKYIILAGKKYREGLLKEFNNYEIPMINLKIGKQLKFLKEDVSYE